MAPDEMSAPRSERFDFLLAALPLVAIAFAYRGYVPLWDGAYYLRCLEGAFGPRNGTTFLFCANHPTGGYLTPLAVAFHLAGLRYASVIAVNAALGVVATHSVHDLSALMFPGGALRAERALVTLGFTLSPLLLACTLHLTPDLGVALFSLLTVRALARHRLGLAAVYGALGAFSKETGAAIYLLVCAAHVLVYVVWAPGDRAAKARDLRPYAPLLLAPVLGVTWRLTRSLLRGDSGAWQGGGAHLPLWRHLLSFSWLDDVLPTQLAEIFVLNFAWVLSVFVLLSAIEPTLRFIARAPGPADDSTEGRTRLFFTMVFVAVVFAVTRYHTVVLARYVLPAGVLLPLMAQRSLHVLRVGPRLRVLLLGSFVGLSLFAVFHTRDAIAMELFGTFEWGDRRMLDLGARAHDPEGGREHLVYNLEFTQLGVLLDEALPRALGDGRHGLALNRIARGHAIGYLDDRTHRRVASARRASVPRVTYIEEIQGRAERPRLLYFIKLPWMDDEDELLRWRRYYRVGPPIRFERDGYALAIYELVLRDDAPPPTHAASEL